ncbi:molybdopterin-dependent oxidoreductase [Micromonospora echinofusca]|uniref:Molybdopterin-dependent oxidoreductase n=1 Tax=Micromonospora echinofusca TaxID=47858 RepID=A0ABS3VUK5_MICEH|nr:molybdopterin-dependent oxidoreductase [Micromonospora echinofusca]MBO4208220.1 molybdopterin-dependent oxidoreductase [Micromonospora echinofusca]
MSSTSRGYGALAGITAAAVAVGSAELVAVGTGARSAPLVAVGGVVVDAAPEPAKQFAIELFGGYDKIALLVGTAVLLGAFAALLGMLAVRRLVVGLAGVALFAVVGVAAAVTRPGAGFPAALPSLLGGLLGGFVLWLLVAGPLEPQPWPTASPGEAPSTGDRPAPEGRRRFLTGAGLLVGAAALSGVGGRWLAGRRGVAEARSALTLPTPVSPAPPVPAGADLARSQLAPYVTSNAAFYRIDTALAVPQVDPETWRLRIHGRVRNPITLTFAELLARPMVERYVTLACVSNEVGGDLVGNARWLGVPIRELLDEAEPLDGADQVVGRSVDGWTCGTPTEVLRDGRDALLAVGMNGEPLPVEHGFPVRMVVPGLYGYVSACKWLVELELTSFADFDAYWVPRGWSARGPVKTQSRIDVPRPRNRLTAGPVTVAGVAWAQHVGIAGVEVRVDGGPWQPATLAPAVSADTWVQWSWQWAATAGEHTVEVRATDRTGAVQTGRRRPVAPDGATGWHRVTVNVR